MAYPSENDNPLSPFQENTPTSAPKGAKWLVRLVWGMFLGFTGLVAMVYFLLFFYLNPYIKDLIIQNVTVHSDSLYQLEISKLNINLWNSSIHIQKLNLQRNPVKWLRIIKSKKDRIQIDMSLNVKDVQLNRIHWIYFLRTGKLHIDKILLQKPDIRFKNHIPQNPNSQKLDNVKRLLDFFDGFCSEIKIKELMIQNSDIRFDVRTSLGNIYHHGDSILIHLKGIEMLTNQSKTSRENLKLKEFLISFRHYRFNSPDGVYEFSANHLLASSKDSSFDASDIKIIPTSMLTIHKRANISRYNGNTLKFYLQSISAKGVDYFRMFYQNEFRVRLLDLNQADLDLKNNKLTHNNKNDETPQQIEREELRLFGSKPLKQLAKEIPYFIQIDTLILQHSKFQFNQSFLSSKERNLHRADSIQLSFFNLRLGKAIDEATARKALYSEIVDLKIQNYTYQSADGVYEAFIGKAKISSLDSVIHLQNAYLKPLISQAQFSQIKPFQTMLIQIEVASLEAKELDIERLAYRQEFVMSSIQLQKPKFEAFVDKRKPKRPTQKYQNFEQLLQSIPLYIIVDTFSIDNAKVTYLETQENDKGFATHQVEDIKVQVLKIRLGQALNESALAKLDTKNLLLRLRNYRYQTANGLYEIRLNQILASSAQSFIQIDSLQINPLMTEQAFMLQNNSSKALLNLKVERIKGEQIDFKRLLLYQEIDWKVLQIVKPTIDIFSHQTAVVADEPTYILEEDIDLLDTDSNRIYTTAPELLKKPFFQKIQLRQLLENIPVFIKIDTLDILQAHFKLRKNNPQNPSEAIWVNHQADNIFLQVRNITLGLATLYNENNVSQFYSDNLNLSLQNYTFTNSEKTYQFSLKNIQGSLEDSVLVIEQIRYRPIGSKEAFCKAQNHRTLAMDIDLKSIQANDIDLSRMIFENEFVIHSLNLNEPTLDFYTDLNKAKLHTFETKGLEDLLKAIPFYIRVDTFRITNASFRYIERVVATPQRPKAEAIHTINKINFLTYQMELALDKSSQRNSTQLISSQNIALSIENYAFFPADQPYKITFDILQSQPLLDSSIHVYNLKYTPLLSEKTFDSLSIYKQLYFKANIPQVTAKVTDFKSFLNRRFFKLHSLILEDAKLDFYQNSSLSKPPHPQPFSLDKFIQSIPYLIEIQEIRLKDAQVNFEEKLLFQNMPTSINHKAEKVNFQVFNFKTDILSEDTIPKLLNVDDIFLQVEHFETYSPDKIYHFSFEQMNLSSTQKTVSFKEIEYYTTITDEEFIEQQLFQKDRWDISLHRIDLKGLDFEKILHKKGILISHINLDSLSIDIYRDKRLPENPIKDRLMPHQAFQQITYPIRIDSISLGHSSVHYTEKGHILTSKERREERRTAENEENIPKIMEAKRGVSTGEIFFSNIEGSLKNFDNQTPQISQLVLSGKLMSEGVLTLQMQIPLLDSIARFTYQGRLERMQAEYLNKMIESKQNLRIRKGVIEQINYTSQLEDSLVVGKVEAGYRKIKIDVLRPENHDKKRGFLTLLANLIIKNNNKLEKRRFRVGKVHYIRKEQDGFIALLWRALATGLLDTLK